MVRGEQRHGALFTGRLRERINWCKHSAHSVVLKFNYHTHTHTTPFSIKSLASLINNNNKKLKENFVTISFQKFTFPYPLRFIPTPILLIFDWILKYINIRMNQHWFLKPRFRSFIIFFLFVITISSFLDCSWDWLEVALGVVG